MSQQQPQKFDYELFTRVIALAKPYKGIFITAGILAVVLAPLSTLRPYLIKVMVDDYIFKYDIDGMTRIAVLIAILLVLNVVLQYAFIYATSWLGQSIIKDLRVSVF